MRSTDALERVGGQLARAMLDLPRGAGGGVAATAIGTLLSLASVPRPDSTGLLCAAVEEICRRLGEKSDIAGRASNRPAGASPRRGRPGARPEALSLGLARPERAALGGEGERAGGRLARGRAVADLGGRELAAIPDGAAILAAQGMLGALIALDEPLATA
jgi:hypothetical protein